MKPNLNKLILLFFVLGISVIAFSQTTITNTFNNTSVNYSNQNTTLTGSITVPSCIPSVTVNCWGAGGGGGGAESTSISGSGVAGDGGGGGGGGYSTATISTAGTYTYSIGAGGLGGSLFTTTLWKGNAGGNTKCTNSSGTVVVNANGGGGGGFGFSAGGSAGSAGTGTTHNGGAGDKGNFGCSVFGIITNILCNTGAGGGGGGGAGMTGNGATATNATGGAAGSGGGGGAGAAAPTSGNTDGNLGTGTGTTWGGGGSGAFSKSSVLALREGGNGGNGQIIFSYTMPAPTITSFSPTYYCGTPASNLVITGCGFTDIAGNNLVTTLTINGTAISSSNYTVNSATQITIPYANLTGLSSGYIAVTTKYGTTTIGTGSTSANSSPYQTLYFNSIPSPTVNNDTIQIGDTAILSASGGVSYIWSTGATTASIHETIPGTYTVTITNSYGCTASISGTISLKTETGTCATVYTSVSQSLDSLGVPRSIKILDNFGNEYLPSQIAFDSNGRHMAGRFYAPGPCSTCTCIAGMFTLYFEDVSSSTQYGFDDRTVVGTSTLGANRRNVVCQVFTDLSHLLFDVNQGNPPGRVHIWINSDQTYATNFHATVPSGVGGWASPFYVAPLGLNNAMIDGEVWKTILGGHDSYTGLPANMQPQYSAGLYHGYMAIDFNGINWNNDFSIPTPTSLLDLYSVVAHEAFHTLGFVSLIAIDGTSKLQPSGFPNVYSRFDGFLKADNNTSPLPLLSFNPSIPSFNYLQPYGLTNLSLSCGGLYGVYFDGINLTGQVTYTAPAWSNGTNLSHFGCIPNVTICDPSYGLPTNDYLMNPCNAGGPSFTKRHPNALGQEVESLCDLGYAFNIYGAFAEWGTYGAIGQYGIYQSYSPCANSASSCVAVGYDDNFSTNYMTAITEPNTTLLANDGNGPGGSISGLEMITAGAGTLTTTTSNFTFTPAVNFSGVAVLGYYPVCSGSTILGNLTYVFINVNNPALPPCNLTGVCNENLTPLGDFEAFVNENQLQDVLSLNPNFFGFTTPPYDNTPNLITSNTFYIPYRCGGPFVAINLPSGSNQAIAMVVRRNSGVNQPEGPAFQLCRPIPPNTYATISFQAVTPNSCSSLSPNIAIDFLGSTPLNGTNIYVNPGTILPQQLIPITNTGTTLTTYSVTIQNTSSSPITYIVVSTYTAIDNYPSPPGLGDGTIIMDNFSVLQNSVPLTITSTAPTILNCIGNTSTINYQICNPGTVASTPVQINVVLPNGLTFVSTSSIPALSFTLPALAPSACINLQLEVQVAPGLQSGVPINISLIPVASICFNSNQNTVTVTAIDNPVTISKSVSNSNPAIASTITYSIQVCNSSLSTINNITITDPLPAGLTVQSLNGFTLSGSTLTQTISTLPPAASLGNQTCQTYSFSASINTDCSLGGTSINNCASASIAGSYCLTVSNCASLTVQQPAVVSANAGGIFYINDCTTGCIELGGGQGGPTPAPATATGGSGSYTYLWSTSISGGNFYNNCALTTADNTIANPYVPAPTSPPATYTVIVTDVANGCTATNTATIEETPTGTYTQIFDGFSLPYDDVTDTREVSDMVSDNSGDIFATGMWTVDVYMQHNPDIIRPGLTSKKGFFVAKYSPCNGVSTLDWDWESGENLIACTNNGVPFDNFCSHPYNSNIAIDALGDVISCSSGQFAPGLTVDPPQTIITMIAPTQSSNVATPYFEGFLQSSPDHYLVTTDIESDPDGNVYIAGYNSSSTNSYTLGTTSIGPNQEFIAKLNTSSTTIGGLSFYWVSLPINYAGISQPYNYITDGTLSLGTFKQSGTDYIIISSGEYIDLLYGSSGAQVATNQTYTTGASIDRTTRIAVDNANSRVYLLNNSSPNIKLFPITYATSGTLFQATTGLSVLTVSTSGVLGYDLKMDNSGTSNLYVVSANQIISVSTSSWAVNTTSWGDFIPSGYSNSTYTSPDQSALDRSLTFDDNLNTDGNIYIGGVATNNHQIYINGASPAYSPSVTSGITTTYGFIIRLDVNTGQYKILNANPNDSAVANNISDNPRIAIFPNPFDNQLNLIFNVANKEAMVTVYDVTGRIVFKQKMQISNGMIETIDLSGLDDGAYQVYVASGTESVVNKIIKMKKSAR